MFKKIFLLLSIVFVVVFYAYPCLVLPFGEYTSVQITSENPDDKITITYKFDMNKVVRKKNDVEEVFYYRLDKNEIILSEDTNFTEDDNTRIQIDSIYELHDGGVKVENKIGMYIAIGIGVIDLLMILSISTKKR